MKNIKYELQHIIQGDGEQGNPSLIKTIQNFLRRNEKTSAKYSQKKLLKSEEEKCLINFITENSLFYSAPIEEKNYIAEGAEQKVYFLNNEYIIKLNDSIFYEYWLDYFNSLLIHNYFFKTTEYELLGFKIINDKLHSVVKQKFIKTNEITDTELVKAFLEFNNFINTRNNDYFNEDLGIIFEDLHDENVLLKDNTLFFIDTIFYLTHKFYK